MNNAASHISTINSAVANRSYLRWNARPVLWKLFAMFYPKPLSFGCVITFFALTLTACGGGGGNSSGPSGNGGDGGLATIDRNNGKALARAAFLMADLGDNAIYQAPTVISQVMTAENPQGTGSQPVDQTYPCTTGSVKISGSVNLSDYTGTVTVTYQNCVDTYNYPPYYNYSNRYNGSIRMTVRGANDSGTPTAFDYSYDNYRYEDLIYGASTTYNGDFSVDPEGAGSKFSASVTLVDNTTQQSISSKDYVAHYATNAYTYPQLPAQRSGSIRDAQRGTITVSTDNNNPVRSYIVGAKQSRLRIDTDSYNYGNLHLALDANGDGNYESYAKVPSDLLDTSSAPNTAPIVNVSNPGLTPGRNQDVSVPINGVDDAEFDFLSYSVHAVQSPNNADIRVALQEDSSFSFHTGSAGDYVIALTVDDGRGGVTTQNITLHASSSAPDIQAPSGNISAAVGSAIDGVNLQPSNTEDGPFTYQILSGPSGMTIDSQGNVQWQPSLAFFPRGEVQAQIKISNADNAVTIPLQLTVTDSGRSNPLVRSGLFGPTKDKNIFVLDFNNDGSQRVLLTDNKNLIYTLKYQAGTYVQDWLYPYALGNGTTIDHILPIDVNHDGKYEIAVQIGGAIYIIDEAHNAIARSIDLGSTGGYGLAVADLDNDGNPELITLIDGIAGQQAVILDAATLAEKWRTPSLALGTDFSVGNVDNDAALELVFAGGYVYDGISHNNQWQYSSAFGNQVAVGDIDGDGVDEIIGFNSGYYYGTTPTVYNAVTKSSMWSINGSSALCGLGLVQLDGDAAKEILISDCFSGQLSAFDATSSGTTSKWSTTQSSSSNSFAVGDVDGDGNPDLIAASIPIFTSSRPHPTIFNPLTLAVTFNANDSALDTGFSGGLKAVENGVSQILFAGQKVANNQTNTVFFAIEPNTGATTVGSFIPSSSTDPVNFCVGDYDGDGSDDILFGGIENYSSSYLESYNFISQTQQWKKTVSSYAYMLPVVSCGDFNNDEHTDIGAYINGSLELNDAVNQTLLWSSVPANTVTQLVSGDLDGDGKPELITANNSEIRKYRASGNTYVDGGAYTIQTPIYFYASNVVLSLADIDGDQRSEIVAAIPSYNFSTSKPQTILIVLNSDLTERSRTTVDGTITAIAPESVRQGHLLIALLESSNSYPYTSTASRAEVVDVNTGAWVWRSPMILGNIAGNNLHYDNAAGTSGGRLTIGTNSAMYISL